MEHYIIMNKFVISIGLMFGAFSWGVASLVSDKFEPFDSLAGFFTGQFILSVIAIYFGYKNEFKTVIIYLFSAYIGMNLYAYIFGGNDTRAWAFLGLISTLFLLVCPLIFGAIGKLISIAQIKYSKSVSS